MGQEQSTANQENSGNSDLANYNNRSNQLNGNNNAYWNSRGFDERPDDWRGIDRTIRLPRGNDNNRADQLNPNNPKYAKSRGETSDQIEGAEVGTTSTLDNVMSWVQMGMIAYAVIDTGYQIYNQANNEREQREREEERRAQQLRFN